MQTSVIIGINIIVVGLILLIIPKFRNKISTCDTTNWILTYVSSIITLAGFMVTIIAVPTIINISIKNEQQMEEKIRQIEERTLPVPHLKKDTIIITQKDTVTITYRDTIKIILKDISSKNIENELNREVKEVDRDAESFRERIEKMIKENESE